MTGIHEIGVQSNRARWIRGAAMKCSKTVMSRKMEREKIVVIGGAVRKETQCRRSGR